MNFTDTPLPGVKVVTLHRLSDHRGYFARGWCAAEFAAHGLDPRLAQLNVGYSRTRGTLRGVHFQRAPHGETKLVRCTRGAVFDVAVDLRPDSPAFCRWFGVELTAGNGTMLCVPDGCAHGYQALTDDAEIYYTTSAPYAAAAATGVRYDDPAFGIRWPLPVTVISEADLAWPAFAGAPLPAPFHP